MKTCNYENTTFIYGNYTYTVSQKTSQYQHVYRSPIFFGHCVLCLQLPCHPLIQILNSGISQGSVATF